MEDKDDFIIDKTWDVDYSERLASNYLPTVSISELYDMVITPNQQLIKNLLGVGTYIIAGAPKIGKSFLVMQLGYHVATGTALLGRESRKSAVLYLALEDTHERLQKRLYRMYGATGTKNLRIAIFAKKLGQGLEEQLDYFLSKYPDTKLVIIDTLGKIRTSSSGQCSYSGDYNELGSIKQYADSHGIAIVVVHHTRKQQASDVFEQISGTTAILGAVDGAFILEKGDRVSNDAILTVTSRDFEDQRLYLRRNQETLCWELYRTDNEPSMPDPDPILDAVAALISEDTPIWQGSPQQLVSLIAIDIKANRLTRHLNVMAKRLLEEYHITYENRARHEGRRITLTLVAKEDITLNDSDDCDDCDDCDDYL